ncbi:helix-turn-helix domain-containing protein [Paenibacillus glucanolyticus]|uniref:helix-turn-helix domain-containing protein n=1 Tax=Paenibacillus glucanolyticus TaxID=59843 RepID=UPI0009701874|nr:helix-turn-helix domain-containing protein [Paenibacillus glucanolyticus]OMF73024.1 transcriptional regulator [Paenibacillus glucanolyticus]
MNGIAVRGIRIMLGMTQAEFAETLRISQSHISDVENGRRGVTSNLRIKIAQTFGTGPNIIEAIERAKESERLAL